MTKTCKNCGHKREEHNFGDNSSCNHVISVKKWKKYGLKVQDEVFCPCKKFEANHTLQKKTRLDVPVSEEKEPDEHAETSGSDFDLSEKVHIEYDFKDENKELQGIEVIPKEDVKTFIKKLNEFEWDANGNYIKQINDFFDYINKLAGEKLR